MILSDLNGGISPMCDFVGDPETIDKADFLIMFDWLLFNNGLIMEDPIMLN